jgi:type I restriction enzyme R subunit
MVVAMSQRIAAELTGLLRERFGEETVTCVISASATDDPAISRWRRSASERKQVEADFKDPEHPLRVVVVRDMWLTGFDVPSLYTIYVDKPMRDHGLLQAIARVNRAFRESQAGSSSITSGSGTTSRPRSPLTAPRTSRTQRYR